MRRYSVLVAIAALACAGPADDESGAAQVEAPPPPREAGPRVAIARTGPGELPPAIVGQGGDLHGTNVLYVPGDPGTVGYLAVPAGEGPFPALVIIHEWNGLVDRVRQVADDFAAEGYVTLAADLYGGQVGSSPQENIQMMQAALADMPTVVTNLNAAVAHLKARSDVTGRIGAMGWCFGGGIALSFGLDGVHHEATAIFYGALLDDPQTLARMDHDVYGTFARLDGGPSPDQVAAFETALRAAGIENDLHIYDDVNHGFWLRIDEDPGVRAGPALDAWVRLKAYLDRTLGD